MFAIYPVSNQTLVSCQAGCNRLNWCAIYVAGMAIMDTILLPKHMNIDGGTLDVARRDYLERLCLEVSRI